MKRLNITFGTILLVLGCLAFSPTAQAGPPIPRSPFAIVGTWHVQVFFDPRHTQLLFESYKQWHSDGLEFESANIAPGTLCVGTWKQIARDMVSLYHVGWTYGSPAGTYRFVWTETDTVSRDGNSYDGTGEITYYDENGIQVGDPLPTYPHATRLPPQ
ncbi:MAG: hypothetical protein ACM3NN_02950 [Nitrospirota bacterium]